jgi:hypothetical protein
MVASDGKFACLSTHSPADIASYRAKIKRLTDFTEKTLAKL